MKVVDEGKQAFLNQLDKLLGLPNLRTVERQILITSQQNMLKGSCWRENILYLLTALTSEAMGMNLSPELRDFYSLLYNNRAQFETLQQNIEGSMTLLIIFD